jgi:hypothetical protein
LDFVEKFPDSLFFFFQRDLGVDRLLNEISDKSEIVAEILWLGVAGSRDVCIALTEKNSRGPELLISLAKNSPLLVGAAISVLLRVHPQPRLLQVLEKISGAPGKFWKMSPSVLFRSEKTSRKIFEIFDREDLPSRFACLLICACVRVRPEVLPVRKEFGEQLLKSIKSGTSEISFRVLAAETLLLVTGFTETLLSVDERNDLLNFLLENVKLRLEFLNASLEPKVEQVSVAPVRDCEDIEAFREGRTAVNRTREQVASAWRATTTALKDARQLVEEVGKSVRTLEQTIGNDCSSGEVFDRLNVEEGEMREILSRVEEITMEKLNSVKLAIDRLRTSEKAEIEGRAKLKLTINNLISSLNSIVTSLGSKYGVNSK